MEAGARQRARVLVADGDELRGSLLRDRLEREPDLEVVGVVTSGEAALAALAATPPDLMLLELCLLDISGLNLLDRLAADQRLPPTLVLSRLDEERALLAAFRSGARGCLSRRNGAGQLLDALRAVAAGEVWLDPCLTPRLVDELQRRAGAGEAPPEATLSAREREVLAGIARGLTNPQIARELNLSRHTVKLHVSNLLRKLGLSTRLEAALFAERMGLGAPPAVSCPPIG